MIAQNRLLNQLPVYVLGLILCFRKLIKNLIENYDSFTRDFSSILSCAVGVRYGL